MELYKEYKILKGFYTKIEEILYSIDWESEDGIPEIVADSNCSFMIDDVYSININNIEENEVGFDASLHLSGTPNDNDRPYMYNDIYAEITGRLIRVHEDDNWNLSKDYEINAERYGVLEEELYRIAEEILRRIINQPKGLWYRGHSNKDYKLLPSISRIDDINNYIEIKLSDEFEKRISYLDSVNYPLNQKELYFLMQHHGIPTRLLDWTTNPLVALYFSLNSDDKDGVVQILDPIRLNMAFDKNDLVPFEKLLKEKKDLPEVFALQVQHTNKRMSAQCSEFTYHMNYDFMENIEKCNNVLNEPIIIPNNVKSILKRKLAVLGINQGSIFPDLDNIAKAVVEDVLQNERE